MYRNVATEMSHEWNGSDLIGQTEKSCTHLGPTASSSVQYSDHSAIIQQTSLWCNIRSQVLRGKEITAILMTQVWTEYSLHWSIVFQLWFVCCKILVSVIGNDKWKHCYRPKKVLVIERYLKSNQTWLVGLVA